MRFFERKTFKKKKRPQKKRGGTRWFEKGPEKKRPASLPLKGKGGDWSILLRRKKKKGMYRRGKKDLEGKEPAVLLDQGAHVF